MEASKFKAITFTTYGYKDLTLNLIKSIKENKINLDLEIFALDNDAGDFFKKHSQQVRTTDNQSMDELSRLLPYGSEKFAEVMMQKLNIIHTSLTENEFILYLDGDIVIKRDISNYLMKNIKGNEILFQNDLRPSKPNLINVCAGFMFIRSNKKTIDFFNPKNIPVKKILKYKTHDQTYINKNRNKFKHKILPLDLFPNGPHYYSYKKKLNPLIIHFNYLDSIEKESKMKENGEWYI